MVIHEVASSPTFRDGAGRLSLRQLRAFVAVYRLGKLTAAAAELAVTQSAVSVLIRQIEGAMGVRLFDRSTRQLVPTLAAVELIGLAESILRDIGTFSTSARTLATAQRGRVHLAVTPTIGMALMPAAMRSFVARHADVQVVIEDCAPDQFMPLVSSGSVEFGIGTPGELPADLQATPLLRDTLCVVLTADHPLARRRRVRWKDLAGVPLTLLKAGYGVRRTIDAAAAEAGITLTVANDINFLHSALWITASGLGPSILPTKLALYARDRHLVARPLVEPTVERDIFVVTRHGRTLSPASQRFVDLLAANHDRPERDGA